MILKDIPLTTDVLVELPKASATDLGGIKVGANLSAGVDGTLCAYGWEDRAETSAVYLKDALSVHVLSGEYTDESTFCLSVLCVK